MSNASSLGKLPIPYAPRNDAGNTELFIRAAKGRFKYDLTRERWLRWDQHRWADGLAVFSEVHDLAVRVGLIREQLLDRWLEAVGSKWEQPKREKWQGDELAFARSSRNDQRVRAIIRQASHAASIRVEGTDWDADPYLLGVRNGVIDLRTGELRNGHPRDRILKHCPVSYDPAAGIYQPYVDFLRFILGDDDTQVDWMQRALGLSLSGLARKLLIYLYGPQGDNGKTTLMNITVSLLGDYACRKYPVEDLMAVAGAQQGGCTPYRVDLPGKRMVMCSEIEKGVTLKSGHVKDLTGLEHIAVNPKNKPSFSFKPVFKLWLHGNSLPRMDAADQAIWNRTNFIDFNAVIPKGEQNENYVAEIIEAGGPGILNFHVQGFREYLARGLDPTARMIRVAEGHRTESNRLASFAEECLGIEPTGTTVNEPIYREYLHRIYRKWLHKTGQNERYALELDSFGELLAQLGGEKRKFGKACRIHWLNIELTADAREIAAAIGIEVLSNVNVKGAIQAESNGSNGQMVN